jgi:hypothetical protein
MTGLASTAGEMNVVQRHHHRPFTWYAFGRFRTGPGSFFVVDTKKEKLGCLGFFPHPSQTSGKAWKDVLPLSKQKKGVAGFTITPEEFKKGAVTTPWIYLKGLVRLGICIIHRAQQKVRPNRHDPSKENIKMNSFLSWSVFLWKVLSCCSWTHLLY